MGQDSSNSINSTKLKNVKKTRRSKRIIEKSSNDSVSNQTVDLSELKTVSSSCSSSSSNLINSNSNLLSSSQASSPSNFISSSFYDNEPPFLAIGTDVSAKYKGAFCEAKVKDIHRCVKCRVTFKNNFGSVIITDDNIKGTLRVGSSIQAKHPDKNQYLEGIINKIIDASQYTVVFDDGDETTLRRTSLCLKSGKHFAESESLDHLPLTNPEHFGNPVNLGIRGGRRRRRRIPTGANSNTSYSLALSDADDNESAEGDALLGNSGGSIDDDDSASNLTQQSGSGGNGKDDTHEKNPDWGKVVCVEYGDKRGAKAKETWFPALIVSPAAQESYSKLDETEEYLVKSFINGRYYQVAKKDVKELIKKSAHLLISDNSTSSGLKTGLEKALNFIEKDDLPFNWDYEQLLGTMASNNNSNNNNNNNSCDLNVATSESDTGPDDEDDEDNEQSEEKDRFVAQLYKYMDERGTPINKAPCVANRDLDLYKLYRLVAKFGGYNRVTNKNLWKNLYYKMNLPLNYLDGSVDHTINQLKHAYKKYLLSFDDFYRKLGCTMVNNTLSSRSSGRLARSERTWRTGGACSDKEKDQPPTKSRRKRNSIAAEADKKEETSSVDNADKGSNNGDEDDKNNVMNKRGKKRGKFARKRGPKGGTDGEESVAGENIDEKSSNIDSETESEAEYDAKMPTISKDVQVNADDRIKVKYGKGKAVKIYEAKVLKSDNDSDLSKRRYFVHYTGWNVRYDEWIKRNRIVEVVRDKVTKRKGGNKMKSKASSGHSDHSLKYEDNLESKETLKETKDNKEAKVVTPPVIKRGRPSSATESKQNEAAKVSTIKKETKTPIGGKRRLKTDTFNRNSSSKEKLEASITSVKEETADEYKKSSNRGLYINDFESKEKSPAPESEVEGSREDHSPPSSDKAENEESTDIDTIDVSMSNGDSSIKEERNLSNKSDTYSKENIVDDILTCDENLAKSPPPSTIEDLHRSDLSCKEELKEDNKSELSETSLPQGDASFESEKGDEKPTKNFGKRKRMTKQMIKKEKDKKCGQASDHEEDDDEGETQEGKSKLVSPKQRKKQRKKKFELSTPISTLSTPTPSTPAESDVKKSSRFSTKKKQKSRSPGEDSIKEEETAPLVSTSVPALDSASVSASDSASVSASVSSSVSASVSASASVSSSFSSSVSASATTSTSTSTSISTSTSTSNSNSASASASVSPNVESDAKGKKRKRSSLNKLKQIDIPTKSSTQVLNEQKVKDITPKKKFKKEIEEKKRRDKDTFDKDNDRDEQENLEIANLFKESLNETDQACEEITNGKNILQEMGGSFLLCKEEVPASPVHQSEGNGEALKTCIPSLSSGSEENDAFTSSSSAASCQIALPSSEEKFNTAAQSTFPNDECPQFTPPTTPDSLKSGILSSSTPSHHERESSDNEKNQTHITLANEQMYSSAEIENVAKVAQSLNPLDSLASVAAVTSASQKSSCSSPHQLDDYCSRNSLSEINKKVPQMTSPISSPISSPKKKRRGRVRTSSTSETSKEGKQNFQTVGCKTRGSLGRKARQHFDTNSEIYSNSETSGPMSPAFPSISLSNYSPNAFVYSVNPTSKYNFCTPIDESLEAEKRISILQERLQELRKTYLNIKSEVAFIERRRKKVKKKDKEKDLEKETEKDAEKESLNNPVYNNVP